MSTHVADFEQEERVSRQRAAELLVDIAYALTAGGTLDLRGAGHRVRIPVADEVLLKREANANGDTVRLEIELSWPA